MKKIFFNVSCLVLLVTGVLACSGQGKKDKESAATDSVSVATGNNSAVQADSTGYIVKVGEMAPDFTVTLTDGKQVNLSTLRGKVVMLQFTASWCGVCRKEMPFIEKDIWLKHKNNPNFALIVMNRWIKYLLLQKLPELLIRWDLIRERISLLNMHFAIRELQEMY